MRRGLSGRLRDGVEAGLFLLAIAPFLAIPADWTIRAFGAVGRTLLPLTPAARRIRDNLALARPGADAAEARAIAAGVGDNFGRVLAEYIRMPDVARRPERLRIEGAAHLRAAAAAGRGVMLVSAHFGNWEAIRLATRAEGVECGMIRRVFNNELFDRLSMVRIRRAGAPVLAKGRVGARAMLAHLKRGGAVLVLMDQRQGGDAAIDFLGLPAQTTTALAALCARTGAAMIPVSARREADGLSFRVRFEAPIPTGDPQAMTAVANARISAWIEADPGQWFWLHRRWRGVPRPAASAAA